jgi:hypothetical protein
MVELFLALFTAGGSAGFGSILKIGGGFLDSLNRKREIQAERKFLKEARDHEGAIAFQQTLQGSDNYSKHTRRLVAIIGMLTLSTLSLWSAFAPELQLTTFGREAGNLSILFGLFNYPVQATSITITLGHIALVNGTVVYPMIIGFYFTPGGRR